MIALTTSGELFGYTNSNYDRLGTEIVDYRLNDKFGVRGAPFRGSVAFGFGTRGYVLKINGRTTKLGGIATKPSQAWPHS